MFNPNENRPSFRVLNRLADKVSPFDRLMGAEEYAKKTSRNFGTSSRTSEIPAQLFPAADQQSLDTPPMCVLCQDWAGKGKAPTTKTGLDVTLAGISVCTQGFPIGSFPDPNGLYHMALWNFSTGMPDPNSGCSWFISIQLSTNAIQGTVAMNNGQIFIYFQYVGLNGAIFTFSNTEPVASQTIVPFVGAQYKNQNPGCSGVSPVTGLQVRGFGGTATLSIPKP